MSADDERRMAIRMETLAAKRAQMPPQKIKLVYSRNKSNTANKEEVQKIAKLSARDVVNEELRKRQQMNMKIPTGEGVVEDIGKEACGGGDASKQSGSSDEKGENNSQVRVDHGELIEVVGRVVGVGKGQEFEFDREAIKVLGVNQGSDVGKVVGDDIVKKESGNGEKSNAGATVEKQGRQPESSPEIAERSVSPIIMSRGKKARLSSNSSTPSKATSPSSTPSNATSPISIPSKATTPISIPSKATSPSSTPTHGFDTPSPSLERKSRVLSSLIMNDERKVHFQILKITHLVNKEVAVIFKKIKYLYWSPIFSLIGSINRGETIQQGSRRGGAEEGWRWTWWPWKGEALRGEAGQAGQGPPAEGHTRTRRRW